jgi:hypothetical protein
MDVDTAFLYGVLPENEQIHIEIPQGYPIPAHLKGVPNLVGRLKKGLYGLKQSPRLWNQNLDATLKSANFIPSKLDPCLYTRTQNGITCYVVVYVDDLIITAPTLILVNQFKKHMCDSYRMKDLGPLTYFLGMQIHTDRESGTTTLCQTKYINDLEKTFRVVEPKTHKSTIIPLHPNTQLSRSTNTKEVTDPTEETQISSGQEAFAHKAKKAKKSTLVNPIQYRELIGSLMYLMVCTRVDIAFHVSYLARFLNCFDDSHFKAAMQVLRYVIATKHLKITYLRDSPILPFGYSDSDWASDVETRKSTTGYVFIMAGGAVSWKSKLQPTVALSSADAEYMALSASTQESLYLRMLCTELQMVTLDHPTVIHADSESAIAMARNPTTSAANKHIALRHHFTRDHINNGDIVLAYIPTEDNAADLLTKPLSYEAFSKHRDLVINA